MQKLTYFLLLDFVILSFGDELNQYGCKSLQYLDSNLQCQSCNDQCSIGCFGGDNSNCFKCNQYIQDNHCVSECSQGYFKDDKQKFCIRCMKFCKKCSNFETCDCEDNHNCSDSDCQDKTKFIKNMCIPKDVDISKNQVYFIDEENQNIIVSDTCPQYMYQNLNQCLSFKDCLYPEYIWIKNIYQNKKAQQEIESNKYIQNNNPQLKLDIQRVIQVDDQIIIYNQKQVQVIDSEMFTTKFQIYNNTKQEIRKIQDIGDFVCIIYSSINAIDIFDKSLTKLIYISHQSVNIKNSQVSQIFSITGNLTDLTSFYLATTSESKQQGYLQQLIHPENFIVFSIDTEIQNYFYIHISQQLYVISTKTITQLSLKDGFQTIFLNDDNFSEINQNIINITKSEIFKSKQNQEEFIIILSQQKLTLFQLSSNKLRQYKIEFIECFIFKRMRVVALLNKDIIKFYLVDKIIDQFENQKQGNIQSDGENFTQLIYNAVLNDSSQFIFLAGANLFSQIHLYSKQQTEQHDQKVEKIVFALTISNQFGDIREFYFYQNLKSNEDRMYLITQDNQIWYLDSQFQFIDVQINNKYYPLQILPNNLSVIVQVIKDTILQQDIIVSLNYNLSFSVISMKDNLIIRRNLNIETNQSFQNEFPNPYQIELNLMIEENEKIVIICLQDEKVNKIGFLSINYFQQKLVNQQIFKKAFYFNREYLRYIQIKDSNDFKQGINYYNSQGDPKVISKHFNYLKNSIWIQDDYIIFASQNEENKIYLNIQQLLSLELQQQVLDDTFLNIVFFDQGQIFVLFQHSYKIYGISDQSFIEENNLSVQLPSSPISLNYFQEYKIITIYLIENAQYYIFYLNTKVISDTILPNYNNDSQNKIDSLCQLQIIEQNNLYSLQIITQFYYNEIYYYCITKYDIIEDQLKQLSIYSYSSPNIQFSIKSPTARISFDFLQSNKISVNLKNVEEKFIFDFDKIKFNINSFSQLKRYQTNNNYIINNFFLPSIMKQMQFQTYQANGKLINYKILKNSLIYLLTEKDQTKTITVLSYYELKINFQFTVQQECPGFLPKLQFLEEIDTTVHCSKNLLYTINFNQQKVNVFSFEQYGKINCTNICNIQFSQYSYLMFIDKRGIMDYKYYDQNLIYPVPEINIDNSNNKSNVYETRQFIVILDQEQKIMLTINRNNLKDIQQPAFYDQCNCDIVHQSIIGEQILTVYYMNESMMNQPKIYDIQTKNYFYLDQYPVQNNGKFQKFYYLCDNTFIMFLKKVLYQFRFPMTNKNYYSFKIQIEENQNLLSCNQDFIFLYQIQTETNNLIIDLINKSNSFKDRIVVNIKNTKINFSNLIVNSKPICIYIKDKLSVVINNLIIGLESKFIYVIPDSLIQYDEELDFILSFQNTQNGSYQIQISDTSELLPFRLYKFQFIKQIKLNPSYYFQKYSSFFNFETNCFQIINFSNLEQESIPFNKNDKNSNDSAFQKTCKIQNQANDDNIENVELITIFLSQIVIYNNKKILNIFPLNGDQIRVNSDCSKIYSVMLNQPRIQIVTYSYKENNIQSTDIQLPQSIENMIYFEIDDNIIVLIDQSYNLWVKTQFSSFSSVNISSNRISIHSLTFQTIVRGYYSIIISFDDKFTFFLLNYMNSSFINSITINSFYNNIKNIFIQNLQLIVTDQRYIYKFNINIFSQTSAGMLTYYNKLPIQFRDYQKLQGIEYQIIALMGQSRLNIFSIINGINLIRNIKNNQFQYINDVELIDSRYLIIVDQVRVYIYNYFNELETNLVKIIDSFDMGSAQYINSIFSIERNKRTLQLQIINQFGGVSFKVKLEDLQDDNSVCNIIQKLEQNIIYQELQFMKIKSQLNMYSYIDDEKVNEIFIPSNFSYIIFILDFDLRSQKVSIQSNSYQKDKTVTIIDNDSIIKLYLKNGLIQPDKQGKKQLIFKDILDISFENIEIYDLEIVFSGLSSLFFLNVKFSKSKIRIINAYQVILTNCNSSDVIFIDNFLTIEKVSNFEVQNLNFIGSIDSNKQRQLQLSTIDYEIILSRESLIKVNVVDQATIQDVYFDSIILPFKVFQFDKNNKKLNINNINLTNVNQQFEFIDKQKVKDSDNIQTNNLENGLIRGKVIISNINLKRSNMKSLFSTGSFITDNFGSSVKLNLINSIIDLEINNIDIQQFIYVRNSYGQSSPLIYIQSMNSGKVSLENVQCQEMELQNLVQNQQSYFMYFISTSSSQINSVFLDNFKTLISCIYFQDSSFQFSDLYINSLKLVKDKYSQVENSAIEIIYNLNLSCSQQSQFDNIVIYNITSKNNGTAINIQSLEKNLTICNIFIKNSVIQNNNSRKNGGGLYITGWSVNLTNTQIKNNNALESGGAIYMVDSQLSVNDVNDIQKKPTDISHNQANIGGGIRYFCKKKEELPLILIQNTRGNIYNNTAHLYGNNYAMYAYKLVINNSPDQFKNIISSLYAEPIKVQQQYIQLQTQELIAKNFQNNFKQKEDLLYKILLILFFIFKKAYQFINQGIFNKHIMNY